MSKQTLLLLLAAILVGGQSELRAQPSPIKGVVWQIPDDLTTAVADLHRMRENGVEAVRTSLVANNRLLTIADTLGIQFFQEVPVDRLPADQLHDTLAFSRRLLERALRRASRHPSARHFGLARQADTSDPEACAYMAALSDLIRSAGPPDTRSYYVTLFVEDDACAAEVDFVLYEGIGNHDLGQVAPRWLASHQTSVGWAAAGLGVQPDAPEGYRATDSPEAQARHVEHLLAQALHAPPLYAVFVNRWQDRAEVPASDTQPLGQPPEAYGLLTSTGAARPALDVVRGFYTGEQWLFAFRAGSSAPPPGWSELNLFGWGIVFLLGLLYMQNINFRDGLRRYFLAHGFYLETIGRGREIDHVMNMTMLVALAMGAGLTGTVLLQLLQAWPPTIVGFFWLPDPAQALVTSLLTRPWAAVLLFGSLFVLVLTCWAIGLPKLAGLKRRLKIAQRLMLVLWPRWLLFVVASACLVVINLPASNHTQSLALGGVGLWLATSLIAATRTLNDFARIRRTSRIRVLATGLGLLVLFVSALAVVVFLSGNAPRIRFLWHIATRS